MNGCEWNATTCESAAKGGHLPCLMYVKKKKKKKKRKRGRRKRKRKRKKKRKKKKENVKEKEQEKEKEEKETTNASTNMHADMLMDKGVSGMEGHVRRP